MANTILRKRVGKACDSCRLRKTKCDGRSPCSRCEAEDEICAFGSRLKFRNGVYPKGYVEKLLKDREVLASGVQELYHRLQVLHGWTGPLPAKLVSGLPHVHSILEGLGVLTSDMDKNYAADHEEDNALFDLHFDTAPKAKEHFHNLTCASNTLSLESSVGRDCEQPTDYDTTSKQAFNTYHVFPQPAPLPTPPTDGIGFSMQQHAYQGKMDRVLFPLQQGRNPDLTQAVFPAQMHTEGRTSFQHMPWRNDSNLPTTCVQTPPEQYNIRVQQSPLDQGQSPTTQLGQEMDYFSVGMERSTDVRSAVEYFADFDNILEEQLNC